jgi:hypothetical protein
LPAKAIEAEDFNLYGCRSLKPTELTVEWGLNAGIPPVDEIQISTSKGNNWNEVLIDEAKIMENQFNNGNFTYTLDNLIPDGTQYQVRIRLRDASGWSEFSNALCITSFIPRLPPKPKNVSVTNSYIQCPLGAIGWNGGVITGGMHEGFHWSIRLKQTVKAKWSKWIDTEWATFICLGSHSISKRTYAVQVKSQNNVGFKLSSIAYVKRNNR